MPYWQSWAFTAKARVGRIPASREDDDAGEVADLGLQRSRMRASLSLIADLFKYRHPGERPGSVQAAALSHKRLPGTRPQRVPCSMNVI